MVLSPDEQDLAFEALPPLREVIAAHGLWAEKALGQNFLLDQNITDKIARQIPGIGDKNVIEIGPGPGGLTRSLLRAGAKKVWVVEFDSRAIAALEDLKAVAPGRLEIVQADALQIDLRALAPEPRVVAANLPYNIATPLLIGWLRHLRENPGTYDEMVLMFQKEVAQRISATGGTKAYGRLSVICQWLCDVKKLFDLPPSAFTPPPKVVSSVVRFVPKAAQADAPAFEVVEKITASAFGQRRKMIRSSLRDHMALIEKLGINSQKRAEELSVPEFLALARGANVSL
ncbi:MAG: 16S rRNA (adenine(1518)-N(6)/adenine(1519)-N(6))-dimethyltransferase RsmA [Alphaproteobacteria bacterium]|nr:16S rRNA (adenine(1518)-N(6)/adenine(1519)-N(6))-dimethyltransferase RsmA [Alphaproteobacteria bacterium]